MYPTYFEDKKREIYVDGEIYIDVTPNPEKPFIIKTSDMGIKVLGTSFNVSAYRDDAEKSIVLVTGKVAVSYTHLLSMRKQKELAFFRNIAKLVIPVKRKRPFF